MPHNQSCQEDGTTQSCAMIHGGRSGRAQDALEEKRAIYFPRDGRRSRWPIKGGSGRRRALGVCELRLLTAFEERAMVLSGEAEERAMTHSQGGVRHRSEDHKTFIHTTFFNLAVLVRAGAIPSCDAARKGAFYGASVKIGNDEAPHCDAGQDVALLLPTDWVLLDGRGSADDQGIVRYEWTLLQGDPSVDMKSPQPGMLKLSGLREGVYMIQLSVTDTIGQKSDDNVTITVMPPKHQTTECTGVCSRYQFICDDGCCIDITMACDGTAQCPDRSDETFCQSFNIGRKSVTHTTLASDSGQDGAVWPPSDSFQKASMESQKPVEQLSTEMTQQPRVEGKDKSSADHLPVYCLAPPATGPCQGHFPRWYFDSTSRTCRHFVYSGCQGNQNNFLQELDCKNECADEQGDNSLETSSVETSQDDVMMSKMSHGRGGHPVPESGAVLPLALGLAITALLLLMIGCRLQLVRHKLKKLRPITSEESDYLINGMYL
ncbi:low-density lipoprotein receptor-related protein 11 [Mustelus asterias]